LKASMNWRMGAVTSDGAAPVANGAIKMLASRARIAFFMDLS
jgi:hypothetical protein